MRSDTSNAKHIDRCLSGELLYGDDFSPDEVREWFEDEREGYAALGAADRRSYTYEYHELNRRHLFAHLGDRLFSSALGIGSAYGDEFIPLSNRIDEITILEPSRSLSTGNELLGKPCSWVVPDVSGDLPFDSGSFDLLTCFGALHHIPNVSHVVSECARVVADGGVMLVREPIVSMGDWSKPRHGVTKRERGIPFDLLRDIVIEAGFSIQHQSLCVFPLVPRLAKLVGMSAFNSKSLTLCDQLLCRIFGWNRRYHATSPWQKLRPTALALVLEK